MVEDDVGQIRNDFVKKLWLCDESVMDAELLKSYYDRERHL